MSQPVVHEEFADKYLKTGTVGQWLIGRFFDGISQLVDQCAGEVESALEIGAGQGFSTLKLRDILPKRCRFEASEFLATQVLEAQKRNPDIPVQEESVYELDRSDNQFDLLFLLEVLEHLDQPQDALKELARVARGYVILSTPREPMWRLLNFARGKYWSDLGNTPGHIQHWSSSQLMREVSSFFDVVAVRQPLPWTILLLKPRGL